MQNTKQQKLDAFSRLLDIMDELRAKCPWDKEQTNETLRHLTIEETYELSDAIMEGNRQEIKKELGDLMLHLAFYAKIGSETNDFDMADVLDGICEKLISRHPHIYGDVVADTEEQVKQNWEQLKLKEGKTSVLSGVPKSLPSMVKAMRLQEKAKQVGFEWDTKEQVWEKVEEEIKELQQAIGNLQVVMDKNNSAGEKLETERLSGEVEDELGDVFFSLVNFARFLHVDAENALERTNKKFIDRFTRMEAEALKTGKHLHDLSLEEMDSIWNRIKKN